MSNRAFYCFTTIAVSKQHHAKALCGASLLVGWYLATTEAPMRPTLSQIGNNKILKWPVVSQTRDPYRTRATSHNVREVVKSLK